MHRHRSGTAPLELLAAIEQAPFARALKTSFYIYPLINLAHVLAIGALVTSVTLIDLRYLGLLGKLKPGLPVAFLRRIAFVAFLTAGAAGAAMFSVQARDYAQNPAFIIKMGLVAIAAVNFVVFTRLAGTDNATSEMESVPVPARICAGLSILLWFCVALFGRFIGYV